MDQVDILTSNALSPKAQKMEAGGGTQQRPHTDRQLRNLSSGGSTERHKQERPAETMVADSDSRGELPVLDRKLLDSVGGKVLFKWWLWMLRSPTDLDEQNPIHKEYNR